MLTALVVPAAAADSEERGRGLPDVQPAAGTERSWAPDEKPSWEIEFAGHGGVAGLVSRGEVRLALASS